MDLLNSEVSLPSGWNFSCREMKSRRESIDLSSLQRWNSFEFYSSRKRINRIFFNVCDIVSIDEFDSCLTVKLGRREETDLFSPTHIERGNQMSLFDFIQSWKSSTNSVDSIQPNKMSNQDTRYRLVFLGASRTGKSSIIQMFLNGKFLDVYKETVEDLHYREFRIDEKTVRVDILDTAGKTIELIVDD